MIKSKLTVLAKSLRWYHLGFAFLWAATFSALLYPSTATSQNILVFRNLNLAFIIVAVVAATTFVALQKKEEPHPYLAASAGLLLSFGSCCFYVSFYVLDGFLPLIILASACIGLASGLFFILWQIFFTSEGSSRTSIYIPLSAVASAVLCFFMQLLPFWGIILGGVLILPALAGASLYKALQEIEVEESEEPHQSSRKLHFAMRDLWKAVFCVCSLGFIWKLIPSFFGVSSSLLVVLAGFASAALIIALIELFSVKGFEVLRSYQILFPVITGAFLLPLFFGIQSAPVLSGLLMFGFEIVNLLLLITCAVYANTHRIHSTYLYALCLTPTFAAMIAGDILGSQLKISFAHDLSIVVGIVFLCVYVLSFTMFLITWTKRRKHETAAAEKAPLPIQESAEGSVLPSPEEAWTASLLAAIDSIEVIEPLSQREKEIAALIVRGNSVAAIAQKLFISENTVRGHSKSIYRKLDVHSKQELIDLAHNHATL